MLKKVVIPVAGRGTRLLPTTKVQPKEMLPVFSSFKGDILLKPMVQLIFEQLFDFGIRDFCFIVGQEKRAIKDHFSLDYQYLDALSNKKNNISYKDMKLFYKRIEKSNITWINQSHQLGYGHAVSLASSFVGNDDFILHAGDTLIVQPNRQHLTVLNKLSSKSDCVVALEKISEPSAYGVVIGKRTKKYSLPLNEKVYEVTQAVEKPSKKISNLAIMALNKFTPDVMKILKKIPSGYGGEIQITDAIQYMIDSKMDVLGYEYHHSCTRLDIGTPDTYWHAQQSSKKLATKGWM
ncbi:MAG: hypothetical protein HS049_00400 [Thaumarchaeota archaeon]|nr:hypothetical protein [Nitrososphaerota archaeon]